jgi:NAD(P)-dependent dehydrogenase (short-subunit alcohol dehydrogenase family)
MKKTGYGKIVCMGSVAAKDGGTTAGPNYTATKGAIHSLVKWVAKVGAKDGIYVNAIAQVQLIRTCSGEKFHMTNIVSVYPSIDLGIPKILLSPYCYWLRTL